jgi:TonB family protein
MKRKIRNWKIASVLAIVPLFFFAVACQDQVTSLKEIAKNSTVASSIPSEVKTQMDKLQRENPKKSYILIEMNEEGRIKLEDLKILNDENSNKLSNSRAKEYSSIHVIKTDKNAYDQERTFVILEKGEQTNQLAQMTATPDEVFTVVEESAAPKDGFDNMYQYIAKNLQYPKKARESKIEGKVFVQFIVNLDGSLSDFKVIKGIDEACDQEAIRVLKNGPIWNPGKQRGQTVKQQFTMPFVFSLNPQNTTPRVSEVQQNDEVMSVSFINSIDGNGKVVLKGQVLRKSDGTPLPGVNLVIKNRTEGSVTDSKGLFEFHPPIQKGEIVFSFVGFKSEEISF